MRRGSRRRAPSPRSRSDSSTSRRAFRKRSHLRAERCVAIGLFVDAGEHGEEDVPALLGDRAAYAGPMGPDPLVTDLISLDQVHAALDGELAA